ncbi:hypothetical protein JXB11_02650 [Candidatus Woesearchaeota archaeon]|nr:hypothetical protein [Candidatus Woesearchaeota archaeon]
MLKKGQGLSISTIIIAILVLVVLVVLVLIFTGYFSGFSTNVGSCATQGGTCVANTAACDAIDGRIVGGQNQYDDCANDPSLVPYCCVSV